jgi:hypothetical protein
MQRVKARDNRIERFQQKQVQKCQLSHHVFNHLVL